MKTRGLRQGPCSPSSYSHAGTGDMHIIGAPHRLSTSCMILLLFIDNNGPDDVDGVTALTLFGCRFIFRYVGKKKHRYILRSITGYAVTGRSGSTRRQAPLPRNGFYTRLIIPKFTTLTRDRSSSSLTYADDIRMQIDRSKHIFFLKI